MRLNIKLERFDLMVGSVIGILIIAIFVTLIGGDRAGVTAVSISPQEMAHTTTPIQVSFVEPMDTASVESHFTIQPAIDGTFKWNGNQLTFSAKPAFTPLQSYTVTIHTGAKSKSGRAVVNDITWKFAVNAPRVLYLAPATRDDPKPPNIFMIDPTTPTTTPKQITFAPIEVIDYAPSPDGTQIAYSQRAADGTADIYLLTVDTGAVQRVTHCIKAVCQSPDWSGLRLVYQRTELTTDPSNPDQGLPRAWVVNLSDLSTVPMLADPTALGGEPHWSPDGTSVSVYDGNLGGIVIYDLTNGTPPKIIASGDGLNGVFDPTGKLFVYPELEQTSAEFVSRLAIADLANPANGTHPIGNPDTDTTPTDDRQPAWNPDGVRLAIQRLYLDDRRAYGPQVVLIDTSTEAVTPLVIDQTYQDGALSWNPTGDQLLMIRSQAADANSAPGIWIYDLKDKSLRQIAQNGYLPAWLP